MTPEEINKAIENLMDPDGRTRLVAHDLILRLLQEEEPITPTTPWSWPRPC